MTTLPAGWRVENLGLIEAVQFTHTSGRALLWSDNEWRILWSDGHTWTPVAGVPAATSMKDARRVGTAWLAEMDSD